MRQVTIIRVEQSEHGSFGVLLLDGSAFCVTLELPWLNNLNNISCIPDSKYICERIISPKYGEVFEIKNVPNRTHILIHPGNVIGNTEGCILIAQHYGKLKGERAILNSGNTFKLFMEEMKGVSMFDITIKTFLNISDLVKARDKKHNDWMY